MFIESDHADTLSLCERKTEKRDAFHLLLSCRLAQDWRAACLGRTPLHLQCSCPGLQAVQLESLSHGTFATNLSATGKGEGQQVGLPC
jgi:hypothetical protein